MMTTTDVLSQAPGLRIFLALSAGVMVLFLCFVCGLAILVPPAPTRAPFPAPTLTLTGNGAADPLSTPKPVGSPSLLLGTATITATLGTPSSAITKSVGGATTTTPSTAAPPLNTVAPTPIPTPGINFSASETIIPAGASVLLTWSVSNADTVFLNQEKVDPSGSRPVTLDATTTFQIFAISAAGTTSKSLTINIQKLPDLAVTEISLTDDKNIAYTIANTGAGDATRPFVVRVTANSKEVEWDRPISMLAAGQKATLIVPNYTVVGTQNIEVRINLLTQEDPESSYNNNSLTQVLVGPPPVPGNVGGTVINSRLKAPVESAQVTITGPMTVSAATTSAGLYSFLSIPTGQYNVAIKRKGYVNSGDTRSVVPVTNTFDYSLIPCVNIAKHDLSAHAQITDTMVTFTYSLNNACPVQVPVFLGGQIRKNGTTSALRDPAEDVQISVPPQALLEGQKRQFTIPATTTVGSYDVEWTIWEAKRGASLAGKYDESGFNDNLNQLRICPRLSNPTLRISEPTPDPAGQVTASRDISVTLEWNASGGCPPYTTAITRSISGAPSPTPIPGSSNKLPDALSSTLSMPSSCQAPSTKLDFSIDIADTAGQRQSATAPSLTINWVCSNQIKR